jgi:hypothetical protein
MAYTTGSVEWTGVAPALRPSDSYTTELSFEVPPTTPANSPRLLITTTPVWIDRIVIGDENSLLHHKTYFALQKRRGGDSCGLQCGE